MVLPHSNAFAKLSLPALLLLPGLDIGPRDWGKSSGGRSIVSQLFINSSIRAPMTSYGNNFYEFGPFRVDPRNHLVLRNGEPLPLTPKAVDTLVALMATAGQVVAKDELMKVVWPDSAVEEGNLTQNIYLLRKALCQDAGGT